MSDLITIYIPSKNQGKYLKDAIESVFDQTDENWQLILIDDSSNDNSHEIMKAYSFDSRVRILQTNGVGLPAVANLAIANCKTDYLMRLDGDDLLNPYALTLLLDELKRRPSVDLITSDYYLVNADNVILQHCMRADLKSWDNYTLNPPNGAVTLWRTEYLRAIGGYREDLGAQDGMDVWTRSRKDIQLLHVNMPLFRYRRHENNLTLSRGLISTSRRQIIRDEVAEAISSRKIIAVVPCRQNFDFAKDLWSIQLHGLKLLDHSIRTLLRVREINQIIIAGDSSDIKKHLISSYPNENRISFWERSTLGTRDVAPISNLLLDIFQRYDPDLDSIGILKYPHAPYVSASTIGELIHSLVYQNADSSCLVREIEGTVLKRNRYGLEMVREPGQMRHNLESIFEYSRTAMSFEACNLKLNDVWGKSISYVSADAAENLVIQSETALVEATKKTIR